MVGVAQPAAAQALWFGGGVQWDVQRFPEEVVPTRLDGAAVGWRLGAGATLWRHLEVASEWSHAGVIEDRRTTTLDVNGRAVTIASTFRHGTRSFAALGGVGHGLTSRARVTYLAGLAFTRVQREFASNAAGSVLVSPSDTTASSPPLVDRFRALIVGVDAHVRVSAGVLVVAGLRAQPIHLDPELAGRSVRTFVGVGWGVGR